MECNRRARIYNSLPDGLQEGTRFGFPKTGTNAILHKQVPKNGSSNLSFAFVVAGFSPRWASESGDRSSQAEACAYKKWILYSVELC